jgi:hypothetical protein
MRNERFVRLKPQSTTSRSPGADRAKGGDRRMEKLTNHRQLCHLHPKQVRPDLLRDDGHDELVAERGEEEGEEGGRGSGDFARVEGGGVDVAEEEGVHGFVPGSGDFTR